MHYEWTYFEHGRAQKEHENLIRWTQMLPKQPPVNIFNTGVLDKSDSMLAKHYAQYGFNTFYMKTGFFNGGYDYDAEKKREENPIDRLGWGQVGDGYHDTTRYGELEVDEARKTSLGVVMRNWVSIIIFKIVLRVHRISSLACFFLWHYVPSLP